MARSKKSVLNQEPKNKKVEIEEPKEEIIENPVTIEEVSVIEEPKDELIEEIKEEEVPVEETVKPEEPEQPIEIKEEEEIIEEEPKKKTIADLSTDELRFYQRTGIMPK